MPSVRVDRITLREIRLALLEADVNLNVVKAFVDRVRDRAMDQAVLLANRAAGIVVGKFGTAVVEPHELFNEK
mgnify:CR=1 FL=1